MLTDYLAQKNLRILDSIIDLAVAAGMSVEHDNSGQLVIYTGVTNFRRSPTGKWYQIDDDPNIIGIEFLTDEAVKNNDFHG